MPTPFALHTVVETRTFTAVAGDIFSEAERNALIAALAGNPTAGTLIPGTGGVRKLRVGAQGRGKSGGARVIYYFHSAAMPIILITAYAKSERADIPPAMRARMRNLVEEFVREYSTRRR